MPGPVLIVEDDPDVRGVLEVALRQHGYDVVTAGNGEDALVLLGTGMRPSVILLDLALPSQSGWEFRTHLRTYPQLDAIPTIACSGDPYVHEKARALGLVGALQKPFDLDEVVLAVSQASAAA